MKTDTDEPTPVGFEQRVASASPYRVTSEAETRSLFLHITDPDGRKNAEARFEKTIREIQAHPGDMRLMAGLTVYLQSNPVSRFDKPDIEAVVAIVMNLLNAG